MESKQDLPVLSFPDLASWESWLDANQNLDRGVWLKIAKKYASKSTVGYQAALESAICFGWIDGQKARYDDCYWLQKFTPRRVGSRWSKRNCELAERLVDEGRVRSRGLKEIDAAKGDGRWESAYHPPSTATVPEDFAQALAAVPEAQREFEKLDGRNRYSMLYRIDDAKRPETRKRRIDTFVELLKNGGRLY